MADKHHWRQLTNPNYLGAYSLTPGQEIIATIKNVVNEMVVGPDGKKEECIVAHFMEKDVKPMILNSTNCKTIQKLYKTPYIEDWQGRKIQIYADMVKAFGEIVEALRIRPNIPKQAEPNSTEPIKCADCEEEITAFGKMSAAQMAQYTYQKYGKSVCSDCATKLAQKVNEPVDVLKGEGEEDENN